jgi:hypothetical protein
VFSNDSSADWLLGESPSLLSVWKATAIAASCPTVVSEDSSIVWMSERSVSGALDSVELDVLLLELDELLLELDELPVEPDELP